MASRSTTKGLIDVVAPAAGESVTEGTVLEWRKAPETRSEPRRRSSRSRPTRSTSRSPRRPAERSSRSWSPRARPSPSDRSSHGSPRTPRKPPRTVMAGRSPTLVRRRAAAASERPAEPSKAPLGPRSRRRVRRPGEVPQAPRRDPHLARGRAGRQAEGVELSGLAGSGPGGRILKEDVLRRADEALDTVRPAPEPLRGSRPRWRTTWTSHGLYLRRRASGPSRSRR